MDSNSLTAREKAAVLWAEHVTLNTARSRDDVYEEVRRHFSEAEIVELTLVCGLFNMFNRFMDSLHIPLELPDEIDLIKRSVTLDPAKVKTYLRWLADVWPESISQTGP